MKEIKKENLAVKSLLKIFARVSISFLNLLTWGIIVRNLGIEAVGSLSFAISFVAIFSVFSEMGLSTTHMKRYNEENDKAICNGTLVFLRIVFNFFSIFIMLMTIYLFDLSKSMSEEEYLLVNIYILKSFFYNIGAIYSSLTSATTEVSKTVIPSIISRLFSSTLKISFAILGFSIFWFAYAEIFGVLLFIILSIFIIRYPLKWPNREYIRSYLSFSFPILFVGFVALYIKYVDKIMLKFFLGSFSVGLYSLPEKITTLLLFLSISICSLLFPTFAELHSKENSDKIRKLSDKAIKYISFILLPPIIAILLFSEEILILVFGNDESANIFRILAIACLINSIRFPYSNQIISTGHLREVFYLNIVALGMNTILNLIFIPENLFNYKMLGLGPEGAALTYLISIFVNLLIVLVIVKRVTNTTFYKNLWKHFLSALIILVILYNFSNLITSNYLLVFSIILITFLHFFLLYLFNEFKREEINFVINTINPFRIYRIVKREINN